MTETMKDVTAPPTFVPRLPGESYARETLTPRLVRRGLLVAAVAIAGSALLLRPQPAMAGGWSAAQNATRLAPFRHTRMYNGAELTSESWRGPGGVASVSYIKGKATHESRTDFKRVYDLWDYIAYRGSNNVPINARASGVLRDYRHSGSSIETSSLETKMTEALDKGDAMKADRHPPGEGTWYELPLHFPEIKARANRPVYTLTVLVRVGKDGKLAESWLINPISRGKAAGGTPPAQLLTMRILYDYPASIPSRVFEPRPQARNVPVIDVDAVHRKMQAQMRAGLGEKRGVNFRLALLDREGKLLLFWTGPGVGEGTRGDVRLPGVRASKPEGVWREFAQYKSPAKRGFAPAIGKPLAARKIVPLDRIGSEITVAIPGKGGEAIFRNVPVLRVDDLRYDRHLLGYGAPPTNGKR